MSQVQEAKKLLGLAIAADEKNKPNAADLYIKAADYSLKTSRSVSDEKIRNRLKAFSLQAIERAEVLKSNEVALNLPEVPKNIKFQSKPDQKKSPCTPSPSNIVPPGPKTSGQKLSALEIKILRNSSKINGKVYIPFADSDAKLSALLGNGKWNDPDGLLTLAKKQEKRNPGWNRAEEVVPDATIINEINPRNVTQTMIGDCSFVSAMILSAGFERKFKKKILTCSFFPQKDGKPVLNPHGKYCVRLHINGCWDPI